MEYVNAIEKPLNRCKQCRYLKSMELSFLWEDVDAVKPGADMMIL